MRVRRVRIPYTIVYLDQDYLSNIAKARLGRIRNRSEAGFWHSLFDDLKKAVLTKRIACPKSEFHVIEAAYDTRLKAAIGEVIDELASGLEFRSWDSILESQIEDTARQFVGKDLGETDPRVIAFEFNPHASGKVIQPNRQLKSKFVSELQKLLDNCVNNQLGGLSQTIIQQKKYLVDTFMGRQKQRSIQQKLRGDPLASLYEYGKLYDLWNRLRAIGIDTNDDRLVMNFAESELLNTPFIDVFCSIYAVIATRYTGRNMQPGDLYDVPILATVIPYCDVATTDRFMKGILVDILHFDRKYGTCILTCKQQHRLVLQRFIRGFLNNT